MRRKRAVRPLNPAHATFNPMEAEKELSELGFVLPDPPAPGGNYLSTRRVGNLLFLAGVISTAAGSVIQGTVGLDRTIEEGHHAARACALTQLAVIRRELGSLDAVAGIISVNGYVHSIPGFSDSPKVINGASDLLVAVF